MTMFLTTEKTEKTENDFRQFRGFCSKEDGNNIAVDLIVQYVLLCNPEGVTEHRQGVECVARNPCYVLHRKFKTPKG